MLFNKNNAVLDILILGIKSINILGISVLLGTLLRGAAKREKEQKILKN